MSAGFQSLLIYIILTALFDFWYLKTRYKLRKKAIWKVLFFLNMIFALLLVLPIAQWVFQSFEIVNIYMNMCLVVMSIAIILHHSSLLFLSGKRSKSKVLEFVHIPLSHLLLGIPYVLTAVIGATMFYGEIASNLDIAIYIFWVLETAASGMFMILVGIGILNVHRKW